MANEEIHVNDVGTVFQLTVKENGTVVDLSGATTKQIVFQSPAGVSTTKTASFTTDGTDGKIKYTTIADDLSTDGEWMIQASLTFSTGTWRSSVGRFRVYPNL